MTRYKRMVYESPTILAVELMAPYPVLVSITGRYLFLSILLELSAGYNIPFLKCKGYHTYLAITMLSTPSTGSLRIHKACPPRDSDWGHQHPQLMSILAQISQTDMDPNQISATNSGPRLIILSCRRIYLLCRKINPNQHDTQANICNRRWGSLDLHYVSINFVFRYQGSSQNFQRTPHLL